MRNKASLFLMEQLIMLLVFALSAALCLGVFVRADRILQETGRRDEAVILAQNAAQILKYTGDPQKALQMVDSGELALEILEVESSVSGFRQAEIVIFYENSEIFSLQTGWQEVAQ